MGIQTLTPILAVQDVRAASAFYKDVLGFEPDEHIEMEGTPRYGCSTRGDLTIMFHYRDGIELRTRDAPYRDFDTALYFYVDDLEAMHADLKAKGHDVADFEVTAYHMKEFELHDPDGHRLTFGQETSEPPMQSSCD